MSNIQMMQLDNETLNYQYITDLFDEYECFYTYCPEDNCGYIGFYDQITLSEFCEEVCERLDLLFMLERCYNKEIEE